LSNTFLPNAKLPAQVGSVSMALAVSTMVKVQIDVNVADSKAVSRDGVTIVSTAGILPVLSWDAISASKLASC